MESHHRAGAALPVVATGNPPISAEGTWVIKYWGPWLRAGADAVGKVGAGIQQLQQAGMV